jgi:hypothetical protein
MLGHPGRSGRRRRSGFEDRDDRVRRFLRRTRDANGWSRASGWGGLCGRPRALRRRRESAPRLVPGWQPSRRLRDGDRSDRRSGWRTLCVHSRAQPEPRRVRNAHADVQGGRLHWQACAAQRLREGGAGLVVGWPVDARGRSAGRSHPDAEDARLRQHAGTADQGHARLAALRDRARRAAAGRGRSGSGSCSRAPDERGWTPCSSRR